jgi:hypothetical protein
MKKPSNGFLKGSKGLNNYENNKISFNPIGQEKNMGTIP